MHPSGFLILVFEIHFISNIGCLRLIRLISISGIKYYNLVCNTMSVECWLWIFFLKKLIVLFSKNALNWSKVRVNVFMMYINYSFELSNNQRILKKKTVFNIDNIKCFLSTDWAYLNDFCDTEDWSNRCWKFSFAITGINYILKYVKIKISYFKL